jgi:peptide/nickel transport system permease protein
MIFILLTIVFIVMRALPGDPVSMLEGKDIPEEVLARRRAELGLDKPLYIQYISYISSVLRGDLGVTALEKVPVAQYIAMRLPATVELAISSSIIAILIGVFLGVVASFFKQKYLMPLGKNIFFNSFLNTCFLSRTIISSIIRRRNRSFPHWW